MTDSILDSVKKVLGIDSEYVAFDEDIIMHINSVFSTLSQLGVGPEAGFEIHDSTQVWTDFIGTDKNLNQVKTYTNLRVRLIFDPPATSFGIDAMQKQIDQIEWRLNVYMEGVKHPSLIYEDGLSALYSKFMTVVEAGTNLAYPRPSGAVSVYWKFSPGVDVGVNGANIVYAQPGDTFHVAHI